MKNLKEFDDNKLREMTAHVKTLRAEGKTPDQIKQALRERYADEAREDKIALVAVNC